MTMVAATPNRRPDRPVQCRQRFRSAIIAILATIVLSLVASSPAASASAVPDNKKCLEFKEDYDVRNAARDSNVLLIVHESGDKEAREHICQKLENTPDKLLADAAEKGKGAVFAYIVVKEGSESYDGEWDAGNRNFVKTTLGVKNSPSFLFVSKGMDGKSKYSNHISHYSYKGSDSLELSDVEKFIEKKVGYRVGNDVFNIIFFDSVASRFVSYGNTEEWSVDRIKQRLLALLVRLSTLFSFKEPFASIGKLYNRAFSMSFEHGMDYCEMQVEKLQKKLDSKKSSLSSDKIHEFSQKIAILKSFAEPKELTAEDDKQIFIHAALHLGLLIATLLLFIVPSDEAEANEEEKDGQEVVNAEPVVAKTVDGDDKSSKKTK
eukprot:CAMPEP_0172551900 /NCGR_PEP_ID=MMETSP1067-20121228/42083_1 /TAXON_ID=265564 ORGANISM="Thalassiosira punctigera, Strain Tpunct2005C2" /NCGR_SAMPLE_ID=MMETSP1067 /ASSEMBLY_ACC=CAM_ASM_000444 /LENGTH=377 /DNA_ID=CAMNT_0013339759 /DNA_START=85 /DNA_END=1218 /DNA_ORIENTATION=-